MRAETYRNTLYCGHETHRYWVGASMLVGGSIVDAADARHLALDFGITHVLNVETEHDDSGKGVDHLLQLQVPDDGSRFPISFVRAAVAFGKPVVMGNGKLYVHCQMGGSRSPAFVYAVLRGCGSPPAAALEAIRTAKGDINWGVHPYHVSYMASIEEALA